jgi:glycosyltransferase involved in cell wall biosynthesis
MDLHPDAEVASGMLASTSFVARFLEWANRVGYRHADFVVDLGPYMKQRIIDKGVARERTHTVHVWSAKEEIVPTPRAENPVMRELGLENRFVVMYSGNAGVVHDFRDILEAMRTLSGDPSIYFLFVGNGPRRAEIERYVSQHGITNFQYRDYFPREQLRYSLSVADAHLISLRAPFVGISVPGKLYGIMASARPALFVGPARCESAETIREAGCGVVIDPDDGNASDAIVAQLRAWAADRAQAQSLGAKGRDAFLARYEREPNVRAFTRVIQSAWGVKPAAESDAGARVARIA